MSKLVLNGDTSGSVTLDAPAVSGTTTLTLPTTSGTILTTATGQTLTSPVIAGTPTGVGVLTADTAKTATSTSVDFTGIPSWVKRITVMLQGVSTNGSSIVQVQLGNGSFITSGYVSMTSENAGGGVATGSISSGFGLDQTGNAAYTRSYNIVINNLSGNSWVESHVGYQSSTSSRGTFGAGSITLGGVLDRIRITTVNGTDTFDAGSINILYE